MNRSAAVGLALLVLLAAVLAATWRWQVARDERPTDPEDGPRQTAGALLAAGEERRALHREIEGLQQELAELRRELAARPAPVASPVAPAVPVAPAPPPPREPAGPPPVFEGFEREAELLAILQKARACAAGGAPVAAVQTLLRLADEFPATEAGMQADGLLRDWNVRELAPEAANAAEIVRRVRAAVGEPDPRAAVAATALSTAWRLAEAGEVERAAARLRELAAGGRDAPGAAEAAFWLEVWHVPAAGEFSNEARARVLKLALARTELAALKALFAGGLNQRTIEFGNEFLERHGETPFAAEARELQQRAISLWNAEWPRLWYTPVRDRAVALLREGRFAEARAAAKSCVAEIGWHPLGKECQALIDEIDRLEQAAPAAPGGAPVIRPAVPPPTAPDAEPPGDVF